MIKAIWRNKRKPGHQGGSKPLLKKRRVIKENDSAETKKSRKKKFIETDDPLLEDPVVEVTGTIDQFEDGNEEEQRVDPINELLTIFSTVEAKSKKANKQEKPDVEIEDNNEKIIEQLDDDQIENDNKSEDESESNDDDDFHSATEIPLNIENKFERHTEADITDWVSKVDSPTLNCSEIKFPVLGTGLFEFKSAEGKDKPDDQTTLSKKTISVKKSLMDFDLKQSLLDNLPKALAPVWDGEGLIPSLNSFQFEILSILDDYKDFMFNERNSTNGEQLRIIYTLHAINHVLKTRSKVIHHNAKLTKGVNSSVDYRDQGLTRPKVLIIVPFRESAYRIVETMINLVSGDEDSSEERLNIMNHKRFKAEFGSSPDDSVIKPSKPQDYNDLFTGNTDDSFRIGIAVTRKSLKLYADFYSCDIVIGSPLGLRLVIGAEGEKERDYDFLSSIELLIMDQTDVFLMQNWEHVVDIMKSLNLTPVDSHGVDFSRVRMWALEGYYKFYRQSLIFSSVSSPQITSLFTNRCHNYEGRVTIKNLVTNSSDQLHLVFVKCPQSFYRFESESFSTSPDARFNYFIETILPKCREIGEAHTMIYIPSYFDFVKLRNYFRSEDINFTQVCEYTKPGKIAQSRSWFFHGGRNFLLYTERAHFYNRFRIKGIHHLVFYQLPTYPQFYSELVSLLHPGYQGKKFKGDETSMTCTVMYDKFDAVQLEAVVGTEKAAYLIKSENDNHVFISHAKKC